MTQVVEILSHVRQDPFYIFNIMAADGLATQWARASATMVFAKLNPINYVPTRRRLIEYDFDSICLYRRSPNTTLTDFFTFRLLYIYFYTLHM